MLKRILSAIMILMGGLFALFTKKEKSSEMVEQSKDNFADIDTDSKVRILRNLRNR